MASISPTPSPRLFKFSKNLTGSSYTFSADQSENTDEGNPNDYRVNVGKRTYSTDPFIFLFEGDGESSSDPIACVSCSTVERIFKIRLGQSTLENEANESDSSSEPMPMDDKEPSWGMSLPDGSRRTMIWKHMTLETFERIKGSSRFHKNFMLVEKVQPGDTHENVLATYGISAFGLGKTGTLQINVDWGKNFEQLVLLTFVCLFERKKQPTNGNGSNYAAPGLAALPG